jgi:hypothetical protein
MKQLREYIRKEFKRLSEEGMRSFDIPFEIRNVLENHPHEGGLGLVPLKRFVSTIKAAATIPPSYRVFFINNQEFDLHLEQLGIRAEINHKFFWLHDVRERNEAIKELNRVLTQPIPVAGEEGGGEEGGEEEETMEPEGGSEEGGEEEV